VEYITGTDSSDWMVLFASCALNYIRQSACKQLPARMVAHPLLLDLMEYDRTQGTQYYNTLRVYLLCERNIPATAAALIIHRTTLTYRLGKILELTHLNLDNANLRMYLLLSFQLLDQDGSRDFIRN
jgi:sugar diacid utilization regulator